MKVFILLLLLTPFDLTTDVHSSAARKSSGPQSTGQAVSAARINGVYRYGRNSFRVLMLGRDKLKVQFNGEWMTRWGYPNLGEAIGEAALEENVATFIPKDTTKCTITMTFALRHINVTQQGTDTECGFGRNVMANGTYRRIKGGRPKFIPTPQ
jgi:hypothetical protein